MHILSFAVFPIVLCQYSESEQWSEWNDCSTTCGNGLQQRTKSKRCVLGLCMGVETQERKCNHFCEDMTIYLDSQGIYLYSNLKEELSAVQSNEYCKNKGYKHVTNIPTGVVTQYITQQAFKGNIRSDIGGFWTGKLQEINDPMTGNSMNQCQVLVIGQGMHGQWFSDLRARDCQVGIAHPVCELPNSKLQAQIDMLAQEQLRKVQSSQKNEEMAEFARQNYELQVQASQQASQGPIEPGEPSWMALYKKVAAARGEEI